MLNIPNRAVQAFGGGQLLGSKIVRVVYVDETGHTKREPVALVAGLILDPDKQWRALAERIEALKADIPERHREGFIFHAADLEYGGKLRQEWPDEERWALLDKLLALPRELKIPLVVGFTRKPIQRDANPMRESKVVHAMAYGFCIKAADWFMDNKAAEGEVAMMVAEQRKEAREAIEATHRLLSNQALVDKWLPDFMRRDFPISRIKGPPSFATKEDEPLLQIADACAFAFQRHMRDADRSERRLQALFGDFAQPATLGAIRGQNANYGCFWWAAPNAQFWSQAG